MTSFPETMFSPQTLSRLARAAILAAAGASALLLALCGWHAWHAFHRMEGTFAARDASAGLPAPRPGNGVSSGDASAVQQDAVQDLPETAPTDAQMRFAARLSREQHVVLEKMQSEVIKADAKHLGRTRLTMQLRGDYRDIKSVWAGMIEKYPGLALDRFTVRHRSVAGQSKPAPLPMPVPAGVQAPGEQGDDEATVELVQFTRPTGESR